MECLEALDAGSIIITGFDIDIMTSIDIINQINDDYTEKYLMTILSVYVSACTQFNCW